jgi:hypothetical protein
MNYEHEHEVNNASKSNLTTQSYVSNIYRAIRRWKYNIMMGLRKKDGETASGWKWTKTVANGELRLYRFLFLTDFLPQY